MKNIVKQIRFSCPPEMERNIMEELYRVLIATPDVRVHSTDTVIPCMVSTTDYEMTMHEGGHPIPDYVELGAAKNSKL